MNSSLAIASLIGLYLSCIAVFPPAALQADEPATRSTSIAAAEVEVAYSRLKSQPHRRRETMLGQLAAVPGIQPTVTEVAGDRTRQIFEYDIPGMGKMRLERITAGDRAAVRTIAPGIVAKLSKAKRDATVQSAKSLLNQIFSAVAAAQTGGLSSAGSIQRIMTAAATVKSAADARRLLGQAEEAFSSWQLVQADEEDADDVPMPPVMDDDHRGMVVTFGGLAKTKHGEARRYTRRPPEVFPGMPKIVETLLIDATTGLPMSEETSMNGQPLMRLEYFDVGQGIEIDLPECLR